MSSDVQTGRAPSGPTDLSPTWSSSAKDLVTTALGSSRLWATLGHGILNEVYWPSTGEPQIRDFGFIVLGPNGWSELKRVNRYSLSTPQPDIPLPTIVHEDADGTYRVELEVVPDPLRDVLLVRYELTGEGCRLYVLLAPRLGPKSDANSAWVDELLHADGDGCFLCLACDHGFSRTSAGHVGTSDGWQDFDRHGRMCWAYDHAGPGNLALTGELARNDGILGLAFSSSALGATTLAKSSIASGFAEIREQAIAGWQEWASGVSLRSDGLTPDLIEQARRSAAVLKAHEDRTFPGAVVASLSVPWGNSHDDLGGYHLVWARDAVNTGLALLGIGLVSDARRMLAYLVAMQHVDGHWSQNFYPNGQPFWKAVQLDEVGFPILLATKLRELDRIDAGPRTIGVRRMVEQAAGFIVRHGPVSAQDRWEEDAGLNGYTLAVLVSALVAAATWLEGGAREYLLSVADDWNARIEDWIYVTGSELARRHGVAGHYVRIVPTADQAIAEQRIEIRNRGGMTLPADECVAFDFLALARFGLRAADDTRMQDTVTICDALLATRTPLGQALHRYNEDGYGEHADGSPFDGIGIGRGWPLLTGERGHFALQAGYDARPYLETMSRMTGPGGLIPEQVWDAAAIPDRALEPGHPSGSAMPLVWAHSEYLKLAITIAAGRPIELLSSVEDHCGGKRPDPSVLHWRADIPVSALPRTKRLVIEDTRPFTLHYSYDDWRTVEERDATALPFDMHGVALDFPTSATGLVFTRRYEANWEGRNHRIALT